MFPWIEYEVELGLEKVEKGLDLWSEVETIEEAM